LVAFTNWCNPNKTGVKTKGGYGRPITLGVKMKHVYKVPGNWERDGVSFEIKAVNDAHKYLADGWHWTLEDAVKAYNEEVPVVDDEPEALKDKAKSLGISVRKNSKAETLKALITEAEANANNEE
jgi:hypothetical protein